MLFRSAITDDSLREAIKVMNRSRAARRNFVKLASEHCDVITAVKRSAVLRAAWFMEPAVFAEKLEALNAELAKLPAANWTGKKIVTSGIICDNPKLLQIFDDNKIAIAADDVAQESRSFRVDASEDGDPMMALAQQFADQDYDDLLYDEHSNKNRRGEFVAELVKKSGDSGKTDGKDDGAQKPASKTSDKISYTGSAVLGVSLTAAALLVAAAGAYALRKRQS